MAYTLMAESKKAADWPALHGAVMPLRRRVEIFPVPAANGLGLSVPQRLRNELAWEELVQITEVLQRRFGMDVYDMQTGTPMASNTLEAVKGNFLVE